MSSSDCVSNSCNICTQCGLSLPSRNKLFKHIQHLHQPLAQNDDIQCKKAKNDHDIVDHSADQECNAIYVMGGRMRGRTLASIERFNLRLLSWEDKKQFPLELPDMLDHRY